MKISLIALFVFFSSYLRPLQNDKQELIDSFANFQKYILQSNTNSALEYVDGKTIDYLNHLIQVSLHSEKEQILQLPFTDKLFVLSLRHSYPKNTLNTLSPEKLLQLILKNDIIPKNIIINSKLEDITIEDSSAMAGYSENGKKSPFYFHFKKENGKWKVDLTAMLPYTTMQLKKIMREGKQDETAFILSLIEMSTGRKPTEAIWTSH